MNFDDESWKEMVDALDRISLLNQELHKLQIIIIEKDREIIKLQNECCFHLSNSVKKS